MKFLFLILHISDRPDTSNMYSDLIEEFRDQGHDVTIMAPDIEYKSTFLHEEMGMRVLRIKTKPVLGVKNLFKKGIALALLPNQFKKAYNQYLSGESFDWIIMPTPPITLIDFVEYAKEKTKGKFYLILRDIHPHSAASIGLIKYKFMFNYLARRASKGYKIADFIGCMSQGNIDFIASKYPALDKSKLVILFNWQKLENYTESRIDFRKKYNLQDKFIALFGGNIGLGQRIENIVMLAKHYLANPNIIFLIVGKGVKKDQLMQIASKDNLSNIKFIDFMPRQDYLEFVKSVDLGIISINENYAVPTCPSKAVSYMSLKIPIMAIINPNNDYGKIIEDAGAGFWAVGGEEKRIFSLFNQIYEDQNLREKMGRSGYEFYLENLTAKKAYMNMMNQIDSYGKA